LHIAAANGYTTVVQLLLDQKVSLSVIDDDGWQPLHSAAYWNEVILLVVTTVVNDAIQKCFMFY
jgi:ankyrin repeat protein